MRDSVSLGYLNSEKRVGNMTCSGVFLAIFTVLAEWITDETLSRVFDISSKSKQKPRSKRRESMLIKTGYPNLRHSCDFLCFNLMNL